MPLIIEAIERRSRRTVITAFVPIAVALLGIGVLAFVRLPTGDSTTVAAAANPVDPVVTGSIVPERDRAYDLMMLDR